MDPDAPPATESSPSLIRWILGFLLVGACWGLTTPFMRRAAINYTPPSRPSLTDPRNSWLKKKVLGVWYAVTGVLSRPAYAIPLLLNVTGSVWFFVLIGQAGKCTIKPAPAPSMTTERADLHSELSLTVPITNSLAFLFTVLGEWWAEKKVISRGMYKENKAQSRRLSLYRYLDRHGLRARRHSIVRTEQVVTRVLEKNLWITTLHTASKNLGREAATSCVHHTCYSLQ